jgi:hypothetical protein
MPVQGPVMLLLLLLLMASDLLLQQSPQAHVAAARPA